VPIAGPDGNDVPTLVVVPVRPETTDAEIARAFGAPTRGAGALRLWRSFAATSPCRVRRSAPRRRAISDSLRA
jgi:hypothetical protein